MEAEAPPVEEDAAAPGAAEEGSRSNSKAGVPPLSMAKLEAAKRAAAAAAVMEKTFTDRQDLEAFLVFEGGANTIRWRHGCPPAALWKEAKLGDVADSARMTPRDPAKLDAVTRMDRCRARDRTRDIRGKAASPLSSLPLNLSSFSARETPGRPTDR